VTVPLRAPNAAEVAGAVAGAFQKVTTNIEQVEWTDD